MSVPTAELEERRDQALRDLAELEEQVEAGEIDPPTADRLRRHYEADAAAAIEALDAALDAGEPEVSATRDGSRGRRLPARTLLAGAVLVAALTAGGVLLFDQLSPRPEGGFITGGLPATAPEDVSNQELEDVVAANPDVVGMRLALADRYFEAGETEAAYEHYWEALQREPDPHALARLGWIVAEQGEPELGAQLLEESLERRPDHPEAMFLLATVHLQLGDIGEAHGLLTGILEQNGLSLQDEQLVRDLLAELEAAEDTP